jgi:hypothetical protein
MSNSRGTPPRAALGTLGSPQSGRLEPYGSRRRWRSRPGSCRPTRADELDVAHVGDQYRDEPRRTSSGRRTRPTRRRGHRRVDGANAWQTFRRISHTSRRFSVVPSRCCSSSPPGSNTYSPSSSPTTRRNEPSPADSAPSKPARHRHRPALRRIAADHAALAGRLPHLPAHFVKALLARSEVISS